MIYIDIKAVCDVCGFVNEGSTSVKETRILLKKKGWVRRKNVDGVWKDVCDICKHKLKGKGK